MSNTKLLKNEIEEIGILNLKRALWVNAIFALINVVMVPVALSLSSNTIGGLVIMTDAIVFMGTSIILGNYLRQSGETLGGYWC